MPLRSRATARARCADCLRRSGRARRARGRLSRPDAASDRGSVLPEIEKGRPQKGTYEAFRYAPLEEIDKHLRPLLADEDMDLSYSDEPQEGGGILIRGRLKHLPSGH